MKVDFWTGDLTCWVSWLKPNDYFCLWGWMMLREFCGKHNLIKTANEATIGSRNELGHTQWQNSSVQHLTAFSVMIDSSGMCCNNFKS